MVKAPALALTWALCAFLAALLIMLPATLLDAMLDARSAGRLRIAEARGTVWSGSGRLELRARDVGAAFGLDLRWRWQPSAGSPARFALDSGPASGAATAILELTTSGIEVTNLDFDSPAAALALLVPALRPLQLAGELRIASPKLQVAGSSISGTGTVGWVNAGSALTPVWPLGTYSADVVANGNAARVALRTVNGPLRLDGNAAWGADASATWQFNAALPADYRTRLDPLLKLVGEARGDGNYWIGSRR